MKQIKKLCCMLFVALACIFIIPIIFPNITNSSYIVQAATRVKLNTTKKTLIKGATYTLKITGTSKKVTWSSSNKKVATVNSKGKVTAIGKGTATIKAKVGSKTYSCKVTVQSPSLNTTKRTMIKGTTYTLNVSGTTLSKKWSSSNKKVATVTSKGKVTAVGKGTATIKVTIGGKTYSCRVTVETPAISTTKYTMIKGTTYTLSMKGNTQKVTWSSSNKKVATVNSNGSVTAIGKGTATIKATIGSKTYSCTVTVEAPYFSKTTVSVNVASNIKMPLKGTTKTITYKSSNSNIAKVDKYGTIYGVKAGTVKITATVSGKNFTCSVTVKTITSVSGWKTICGTQYYYINGVPATGLQTINNRKYFFNDNGIITSKFGIDVSGWQKDIDWEKAKADGVQFAIIRCGYGMDQTDQDDSRFQKNVSECKRLGIPFGVYLFSYANTIEKAESEADHALRLVKGCNPSLGIWYDIEDNNTSGKVEKKLLTDIINTFCNKIEENGYKVGIYASTSWLNHKIDASITSKYPVWVAQYYSTCEYKGKYTIWQYSSNGAVNGISTKVDYNIMF